MVTAVVQKLRIIQAFGWLSLRLLDGLDRGCCRGSGLKNVNQSHDNDTADQRKLEFFHSSRWHLLFCDLPAFDLPDLQIHDQRKKKNEDQRNRQTFTSEA